MVVKIIGALVLIGLVIHCFLRDITNDGGRNEWH